MPKISINIDDVTTAWLAAKQRETGSSRTDVILAVLKACQASENAPPVVPPSADPDRAKQPTSEPTNEIAALQFTLDTLFQRYLTDHPMDDKTATERWETFVGARIKLASCLHDN